MTFITKKQVQENLKRFGFVAIDSKVSETLNKALGKFTKKALQQAIKKSKKASVIKEEHVQLGGRVLMPSEWYGVDSGRYFDNVEYSDFKVTDDYIRPPLDVKDPQGYLQNGGAMQFTVTTSAFKEALKEAKDDLGIESVKISKGAHEVLKAKFETKITEILKKLSKKEKNFSSEEFEKILEQKKYAMLT